MWLVKHALRSAIKRGEQGALEALGYGDVADVKIVHMAITPQIAKVGSSVQINFELINQATKNVALMVDFAIHFITQGTRPSSTSLCPIWHRWLVIWTSNAAIIIV